MSPLAASRASAASYPSVRVVHGPAFELVTQLGAFTSGPVRASLEAGKGWIREVRRLAGADLLALVQRYALGAYGELATVVLEAGPPYDIDRLVATLSTIETPLLRRRLSGADSELNRTMVEAAVLEQALAGDPRAQRGLVAAFAGNAAERRALKRLLASSPRQVRQDLLAIVKGWAARVFPAFASDALAAIAREAANRRRQLRARSGRETILDATNGLDYRPQPWIRRVALVPIVALRPFMAPTEFGGTALFLYPVADEAMDVDPAAPPRRLVKRAAALGDPLRLRVLALLRGGGLPASEIADRLGIDRTSLHHHLGILRSAGLLAIEDEGLRGWRYRLRSDGIGGIGADIEAYLDGGGTAGR